MNAQTDTQFEAAVDAVIQGDTALLVKMLREEPELVRLRSSRTHAATLLHYTAANGVEQERQRTPANIVEVASVLLKAGAEVDAKANLYGGATTLELAATSVYPERAGVQEELLSLLLDHGAEMGGTVTACLANGRFWAAQYLAGRSARVDFAAAAGLGRLDEMKQQLNTGFWFACQYGQNHVVEFLLNAGTDIAVQDTNGQTGLHWAVAGGHLDTVKLLLRRGAPLEVKNGYGGTVLGQALWSDADEAILDTLIDAGAVRS